MHESAVRAAGVERASAVALVNQDDIGNIHVALRVQELNGDARLVIRFFNMSLGQRIQALSPTAPYYLTLRRRLRLLSLAP